jgi:hypothetical protein
MTSRQVRRYQEREATKPSRIIKHQVRRSDLFPRPRGLPEEMTAATRRAAEEKAALKGRFDGNCNRTACQEPIKGRNWWNDGTRAYYCTRCAHLINDWPRHRGEPLICRHVTEPVQ